MLRNIATRFVVVLGLFAAGCASEGSDSEAVGSIEEQLVMNAADASLILDLVNYPGTDAAVLDGAAGIDARAARNIIARRNGPDGALLTADDQPFSTIADLDAIPYVADAAFGKLLAYATAHPAPSTQTVEGVTFAGWEAEAVVFGVNVAPAGTLDGMLDARAANGLLARRPFGSVNQMGPVPYVGTGALERLRREASVWWSAMHNGSASNIAGTFDGVTFEIVTARDAVEIANEAEKAQLTAFGITAAAADAILAGRPYDDLAGVAAVKGVGKATMQSLKTFAESGEWDAQEPPRFVLDDAALASITRRMIENLWEDESFVDIVIGFANGDNTKAAEILNRLGAEIQTLAEPLAGNTYVSEDVAYEAVQETTPVKFRARSQGWTYLRTLGLTP